MSAQVRVTAPAKINLCLGVGPVRHDGYHPLATVYQAVGLYDEVVLRPAAEDDLTVSGDGVDVSQVPLDAGNLALRAVHLLGEHHGEVLTVAVHVRKRIPVAGGLAGGSADAAAALVAADALFELRTPRTELLRLAGLLGSDVPFCVLGGTAMGAGRGELVTPVMTRGQYWWVLLPDADGLSTPEVYRRFDELTGGGASDPEVPDELLAGLRAGDPARVGAALTNDLQPAALAFRPDLRERLAVGRAATAHGALVSGSGPTTVFLCDSPDHADEVSKAVQDVAPDAVPLVVAGPVHGARVTGHR